MKKLDHVAVRVSDMQTSLDFYTEKMGFQLMFHKVDLEHQEAFAFFELEGGNLELLQILDDQGQPLPYTRPELEKPYCPHIAIRSDNLDDDVKRLQQHEIPILAGPLEIPGSVRWLYFADPDNNVLEYIQWLEKQTA